MRTLILSTCFLFMLAGRLEAAEWLCVAKDQHLTYEGRSSDRKLAEENALATCRFHNADEALCRLQRCDELTPRSPESGK